VDETLSVITTDMAHTGLQSLRIAFTSQGGSMSINRPYLEACPERVYRYSFYANMVSGASCTATALWGGVALNTHTLQLGAGWVKSGADVVNLLSFSPNAMLYDAKFVVQVNCTSNDLGSTVYLDDLSLAVV
jgi:hypothetical protein